MYKDASRVVMFAFPQGRFLVQLMAAFTYLFLALSASAADRPASFADQVEALSPAVVNISTTTVVNDGAGVDMPQFPPGSPFEEFFKNFGDPQISGENPHYFFKDPYYLIPTA